MLDLLLNHGSYLGIIVFMILTGAGLPFPEEVAIVAAGVLSSPAVDQLDPWLAWASCLFGALAGDCVMYWIGHHFGRRVLREHHWWTRFIKPDREAQMERMLEDHGFKVLFLARFLVGVRSPVYLSAGILRMPFWRFMLIDLFCATTVISTFFWLSYFIGERIYVWVKWIKVGEGTLTVIVAVAVVSVAIYLWRRHKRRVAAQSAEELLQAAVGDESGIADGGPTTGDQKDDAAGWHGGAEDPSGLLPGAQAGKPLSDAGPRQPAP